MTNVGVGYPTNDFIEEGLEFESMYPASSDSIALIPFQDDLLIYCLRL
jgi:hypothetical protein